MWFEVVCTLVAAVLFAGFHVPLPLRGDGRVEWRYLSKIPSRTLGVGYHVLMLPAVAALPSPVWAMAAGFAWMLLDIMLDAADLAGTEVDVRPLRQGVHVIAAVWLLGAGWTGSPVLALAGTLHAANFLFGLGMTAAGRKPTAPVFRHAGAILNIIWMLAVAWSLAQLSPG